MAPIHITKGCILVISVPKVGPADVLHFLDDSFGQDKQLAPEGSNTYHN